MISGMQKYLSFLILLLTLDLGAEALAAHDDRANSDERLESYSLHLIENESFEQVGLVGASYATANYNNQNLSYNGELTLSFTLGSNSPVSDKEGGTGAKSFTLSLSQ